MTIQLSRRTLMSSMAGGLVAAGGLRTPSARAQTPQQEGQPPAPGFTFDDLVGVARELAAQGYAPPPDDLPPALRELSDDQYRAIRFQPERALWLEEKLPFQVQFFHRGGIYPRRVKINIIDGANVYELGFSSQLFTYEVEGLDVGRIPPEIGFGGFRLHFPLNRPDVFDEVAAFRGANSFHGVGRGQVFGTSARAIAIDTALSKPEEFPVLKEFWIEKPQPSANALQILGLLDGPSLAGAYRFVIRPGDATVFETEARLFARRDIERIGYAPLTSMFAWNEMQRPLPQVDDYRPEVHDADGLMINASTGEWMWRPLTNPRTMRLSPFPAETSPNGFGLLQRDRAFGSYQDLLSLYQMRASAWVEPLENWGEGAIQLAEFPTDQPKFDNIVAYWTPDESMAEGEERAVRYRLNFALDLPGRPPAGRVIATRTTPGPGAGWRRYLVEFNGGRLGELGADAEIEAVVTASEGRVIDPLTQHNRFENTWRAVFDFDPEEAQQAELRMYLQSGDDILTETWICPWPT
ncbi:glucan biosynthesis protein [Marinivivus vitaminiproducens]|uniref:glucan biosynthesis protein n=1 Tax=Marinivivus vitaminiproducens TaxID=3035935 RepID=UPI0027A470E0|nr:glucan biosynthesis protein [Geminicoccaceae bacterium SCSIO 64248]